MRDKPLVMVDTNVWVDLYVPGRPKRETSLAFFEEARRSQAELVFTIEIAQAVHRIVSYEAKRWRIKMPCMRLLKYENKTW